MKLLICIKLQPFFIIFVLSVIMFVTNNSCQKVTISDTIKTHTPPGGPIVYTDVNPDIVIHGTNPTQQFYIDLNNDGSNDFKFEFFFTPNARNGAECQPGPRFDINVSPADGSSNAIAVEGNYPAALGLYAIINGSHRQWSGVTGEKLLSGYYSPGCGSSSQGKWTGNVNKYLGLKLISGAKAYYGWVNLSISVSGFYSAIALTVQSYVYNSVPNQPILAGQTR